MAIPGVIVEPLPDAQLQRFADGVRVFVVDVQGRKILDGVLIEDVALGTSETAVPHKLGRKPYGASPVSPNAAATIHHSNESDSLNLYLTASATVTTSLWVF